MFKKTLIVIFTLAFIISLASCDDKVKSETSSAATTSTVSNTESSTVSLAESSEESSVVSEESSEITSEAASKSGVIEGVFYSDAYSFTVPEGYTLGASDEANAMFTNGAANSLIVSIEPNTEKLTTTDKATIESKLSPMFGTVKLSEFTTIKVDESNSVYFTFKVKSGNVTINMYMSMVFTEDSLYTFVLTSTDTTQKAVLTSVLDSFKFAE